MATGLASWSKTAATNATADSTINWAEGQAPSSVNDSARALMASAAKYRDDVNGSLVLSSGSATAYTVTTNQVFASLTALDSRLLCIVPDVTSGASVTLAVDGLAAKQINSSTGVAIPTGAMVAKTPYFLIYFNATTEFILLGSVVAGSAIPNNVITPVKLATSAVSLAGGMMNGTLTGTVGANLVSFHCLSLYLMPCYLHILHETHIHVKRNLQLILH